MKAIPFFRPSIGDAEIEEVVATLRGGWLTTGPRAQQFEREFASYLGHRHAVAVNSCTAALHLALEAIQLQAGQGVLVPTMTFAATAEVVRYFDAVPILVDCRLSDFNIDVADAEARLQAAERRGIQVKAIMPVHYGGQIGDVEGVGRLARKFGLKIIEDAAHCCPAYFRESETHPWFPVGRSSDISCFSFYANKCITSGEGGMACTENPEYADRMRHLSLHGISRDAWKRFRSDGHWYYEITAPGYKYNLTDIAAALGIQQLRQSDRFHRRRCELAAEYSARLVDIDEIVLPHQEPNRVHSWHLYPIRLQVGHLAVGRSQFIDELSAAGIGVSVHYLPLHMHPYYRDTYGYSPNDLPNMAEVYPQIISLPLFADMSDEELERVCDTVRDLIGRHRKSVRVEVMAV